MATTRRGGHQQHTDPLDGMGGSLRRSCTPDPEDPQRNPPVAHGTPHKDPSASATAHVTNARQLMVRYKALINDVVVCMGHPINLPMIDDFIALTEDALRGLRTTKVDARSTLRRMQSNPLPLSRRDEPEVAPQTPPPHQQSLGNNTQDAAAGGDASGHATAPPALVAAAGDAKSRSYMAAVQGRSAVSPAKSKPRTSSAAAKAQELEKRAQELTVDRVVEARDGSALRSEERHRHAEERRKELLDERQKKIDEASGKSMLAKQRRESAQEKLKSDTRERHESATRRAEESKSAIKEKAQKSNVRVDEVLFVNDMQQKNKQLKLEMKLSSDVEGAGSPEQRREEATRQLKERHEAHAAEVEARQRDLTNQRTERQQQREAHRLESLRRLEEQKRMESEQKHQKIEEREKKVQAQLLSAQAEAEARKARTEERINQSALLREEQREKQKMKLEKSEQKLKEAKERRDREEAAAAAGAQATKPTFAEAMPTLTSAEEDVMTQKLARSVVSMQRQAKTFLDQYQKECALSAKDINKSRLRALFARVGPTNLTQARQPLHDIATSDQLAEIDHEFVRHSNGFDALVKVLIEARKVHDFATLRVCSDALHRFLTDAVEGPMHTKFFVRAGHLVTLIAGIHEEIKTLRKHNRSITLTSLLSLVSLCVTCVVSDNSSPVPSSSSVIIKVAPVRDQIMSDLESVGLDRFCFAIASTCVDEEDMACLQYALLILYHHVLFLSRKRSGDGPTLVAWISQAVTALFTLLQNILTPGGQPLRPQDVLSPLTSCVIFTALRILCTISRWKLDSLQDFLRGGAGKLDSPQQPQPSGTASNGGAAGGATRHELFHIVSSFFHYVASHDETLEHLPPTTSASDPSVLLEGGAATLRSFHDALQFGVTLTSMPRVALPTSCTAAASDPPPTANTQVAVKPGAPATIGGPSFLRASLHELVLLVGYMTLGDTSLQEIFSWGKERPLLALLLSSLPMPYFSQCRHVLFPTLLSILHRDDRNKVIAAREMDLDTLEQFLKEEYDALPSKLRHQSQVFHEALEADAAAAKTAASLPPPKPVTLPKKSWNDLLDEDDDEEVRIPSPGHPGKPAVSVAATAPAERTKAQAEKERLAKAIKSMAPGLAHFRCDRRFPPNMWVDMLVFLSKPLPPPAPEL